MDLLLAEKKPYLEKRARILQAIRAFFVQRDFLEVETPQRIPANAPEANILPIRSEDWQLQTSPELAMKRLLAAGYPRIFQLCHCWRAEERGTRHLPEFTLLEWYRSAEDYRSLMEDCESLIRTLVPADRLNYRNVEIELEKPFERLSVDEAFQRFTATSPAQALRDDRFDALIAFEIEPHLGLERPTFLYDYPAELAALARTKTDQSALAERFELYIAGIELANGFSELTDTQEQRRRFCADANHLTKKTGRPTPLPEPFLAALPDLPAAAGIALGIDRLVMLLCGAESLDQVIAFPPENL